MEAADQKQVECMALEAWLATPNCDSACGLGNFLEDSADYKSTLATDPCPVLMDLETWLASPADPSGLLAAASGRDEIEPPCSICLESVSQCPLNLACGHSFCHGCLVRHVEINLQAHLAPWCPLCRCKLCSSEVIALCPASCLDVVESLGKIDEPPQPSTF